MLGQFDSTQEPRFLTQRHGVFGLRQRSGLRRRGGVTGHAITGTGVPLAACPRVVPLAWCGPARAVRRRGLAAIYLGDPSGMIRSPWPALVRWLAG